MAILAQEKSRKTSIRVKSGQQTSMDKGVFFQNGSILGYKSNWHETNISKIFKTLFTAV